MAAFFWHSPETTRGRISAARVAKGSCADMIEAAEASFTFEGPRDRPYPPEYIVNPLGTIIERDEPMRAFAFLVGEYTLRRCKN